MISGNNPMVREGQKSDVLSVFLAASRRRKIEVLDDKEDMFSSSLLRRVLSSSETLLSVSNVAAHSCSNVKLSPIWIGCNDGGCEEAGWKSSTMVVALHLFPLLSSSCEELKL